MDEKEVLGKAADELTSQGGIEQVEAILKREKTASFPVFLFIANAVNDVVVDPIATFANLTGVGWVLYMILLWAPLMLWNFLYLWGKVGFWKKTGIRFMWRYAARMAVRALVVMGVASAVPFAGLLFPQCLFILIAHNRHNRFVAQLLAAAEIIGRRGRGGGDEAVRQAMGQMIDRQIEETVTRTIQSANIPEILRQKQEMAQAISARQFQQTAVRGIVRAARNFAPRGGQTSGQGWANQGSGGAAAGARPSAARANFAGTAQRAAAANTANAQQAAADQFSHAENQVAEAGAERRKLAIDGRYDHEVDKAVARRISRN
jgi:hypothetical protein